MTGEGEPAGVKRPAGEEAKLKVLRALIAEGEASGFSTRPFCFAAFRARMRKVYGEGDPRPSRP